MKGETALEWLMNWAWLIVIVIIVSMVAYLILEPKIHSFLQPGEEKYPTEYQSCYKLSQNVGNSEPTFTTLRNEAICRFKVIKCKTYDNMEWCKEENQRWTALLPT